MMEDIVGNCRTSLDAQLIITNTDMLDANIAGHHMYLLKKVLIGRY